MVNQASWPSLSSGRVPCTVTPIGRVCGAAIGIAVRLITSRMPSRRTSCSTAAANRSHWVSGSGPASSR